MSSLVILGVVGAVILFIESERAVNRNRHERVRRTLNEDEEVLYTNVKSNPQDPVQTLQNKDYSLEDFDVMSMKHAVNVRAVQQEFCREPAMEEEFKYDLYKMSGNKRNILHYIERNNYR